MDLILVKFTFVKCTIKMTWHFHFRLFSCLAVFWTGEKTSVHESYLNVIAHNKQWSRFRQIHRSDPSIHNDQTLRVTIRPIHWLPRHIPFVLMATLVSYGLFLKSGHTFYHVFWRSRNVVLWTTTTRIKTILSEEICHCF